MRNLASKNLAMSRHNLNTHDSRWGPHPGAPVLLLSVAPTLELSVPAAADIMDCRLSTPVSFEFQSNSQTYGPSSQLLDQEPSR